MYLIYTRLMTKSEVDVQQPQFRTKTELIGNDHVAS